jgi:hypothetical protein
VSEVGIKLVQRSQRRTDRNSWSLHNREIASESERVVVALGECVQAAGLCKPCVSRASLPQRVSGRAAVDKSNVVVEGVGVLLSGWQWDVGGGNYGGYQVAFDRPPFDAPRGSFEVEDLVVVQDAGDQRRRQTGILDDGRLFRQALVGSDQGWAVFITALSGWESG